SGLSATLRDKVANPQNLLEPATRAAIPSEFLPQLIHLLADSIWYAFLTALLLMIIGCVVSIRMGSYTPASTPRPDGKPSQVGEASFRFHVSGFRFQVSGFRFQVSGFRFQVSGFRFQVSGFRFQVSGFRFQVRIRR